MWGATRRQYHEQALIVRTFPFPFEGLLLYIRMCPVKFRMIEPGALCTLHMKKGACFKLVVIS